MHIYQCMMFWVSIEKISNHEGQILTWTPYWTLVTTLRCTPLLYLLTEVCVLLLQGFLLGGYKQGPCGRRSIHVDLVWSNFWHWNYLDICGYKHLQQYHNRCKTSWLHTQLLIQVESKSFSNSHVLLCPCREHSIPFTTSGFRHWAHTLVMSHKWFDHVFWC